MDKFEPWQWKLHPACEDRQPLCDQVVRNTSRRMDTYGLDPPGVVGEGAPLSPSCFSLASVHGVRRGVRLRSGVRVMAGGRVPIEVRAGLSLRGTKTVSAGGTALMDNWLAGGAVKEGSEYGVWKYG